MRTLGTKKTGFVYVYMYMIADSGHGTPLSFLCWIDCAGLNAHMFGMELGEPSQAGGFGNSA